MNIKAMQDFYDQVIEIHESFCESMENCESCPFRNNICDSIENTLADVRAEILKNK